MKSKKIIIILSILSLIGISSIGIGVYFLIDNKNKSVSSDSNNNATNNDPNKSIDNQNNFDISIDQENNDPYYISKEYKFKANIKSNNINDSFKYNWEINGPNSSIINSNNNNELLCTFNEVGNYTIILKVSNQNNIEKNTSININVIDSQNITINVNNLKNEYNILEQNNLSISLSQNISNPYYEWSCNDSDLILSNINSNIVGFKSYKTKSYELNINVYKDNSKNKLLCSKTIQLNFNKMYNLKIHDYNSKLEKYSTNDPIDFSNNSNRSSTVSKRYM